jgi:hypothetical protein
MQQTGGLLFIHGGQDLWLLLSIRDLLQRLLGIFKNSICLLVDQATVWSVIGGENQFQYDSTSPGGLQYNERDFE